MSRSTPAPVAPRSRAAAPRRRALPPSWSRPEPDGSGLDVAEFPSVLLVGTATLIQRHLTRPALELHGIGVPEWRLIAFLSVKGPNAASAMAAQMWMDKAQISRALEALIARGLARRTADPTHGRRQLVQLTAQGKRLYAHAFATARRQQSELLSALTPGERAGLFSALAKLRELAERAGAQPAAAARPARQGQR